jgi:hypothetical protein
MTLQEIQSAVRAGKRVHWASEAYDVICDRIGQWHIRCNHNRSCIGLTWQDGVTVNGAPDQFFVADPVTQP